eukprot:TRINITY_DN3768_c0_g1_i1.p1 TRINITY_DN3768_c0_g1~~TRINITY_DN3768_c0_g1_i1.p1  ORF type:complete len:66 (-),score=2.11 TRINITY_DN3768_c0_g1_i1:73-270(-)
MFFCRVWSGRQSMNGVDPSMHAVKNKMRKKMRVRHEIREVLRNDVTFNIFCLKMTSHMSKMAKYI